MAKTDSDMVNVTPEQVFAQLQQQVAQQALDLAAERAANESLRAERSELRETIDQLSALLPKEKVKGVIKDGKDEGKPNRSQRRASGNGRQAK